MGLNPALLAGRSPLQAVPCAPFAGTSPSAFGSPILPLGASGSEERSLTVLPQGVYKACVAASKLGDLYRKLQSKDLLISSPGGEYHGLRMECKLTINRPWALSKTTPFIQNPSRS